MIGPDYNTIIAQCTPKGSGAIALLRISGADAFDIADKFSLLASNIKVSNVQTHTIHYGQILDHNNEIVDQVMFIVMRAPKTFTGENVIEITCHNNPFIIEKIISLSIENGARLAQPGEFAKRSYLNGKIDLIEAEAINELLNAHTQESLKKSLSNLQGSFSNYIQIIETKLMRCLALCNASFEFLDDEIEFESQINEEINNIIDEISTLKKTFNKRQQIKEGIRVALIGSVNAGKSSLFNALLSKERAIVSNIAGTTRDSIEAGIYTSDYFMTLVDTAGLRQTEDIIEQQGIQRSFDEAAKADIILLVIDGSRTVTAQEAEIYNKILLDYPDKVINVINKSDLVSPDALSPLGVYPELVERFVPFSCLRTNGFSSPVHSECSFSKIEKFEPIRISSKTRTNINVLEQKIKEKIANLLGSNNSPFLLNQRQFNLLLELEGSLFKIQDMFNNQIEYELLSIHINEALASLSELTGKTISEKSMDTIFKEFCVGK